MSTPAERFRRWSSCTVFDVASTMSINRLCVSISKCSRLSLSLCGPRITVYTGGSEVDLHRRVVTGHDHLHALGKLDGAGDVRRPEVELRAVALEERRVAAA